MTALTLGILCGVAALAIDVGLAHQRHVALQAAADMSALDDAWALPLAPTGGNLDTTQTALAAGLAANGFGTATSTDTLGLYTPTQGVTPATRYVAGGSYSCGLTPVSNAVSLQASTTSPVIFGRVLGNFLPFTPGVQSVAARNIDGAFRVGSGLLSIGQASIANAILGQLIGTNVSLTALDYQNLLGVQINTLDVVNALASNLSLTAGTYSSVLKTQVTIGQLISAEASALSGEGVANLSAVSGSLAKLSAVVSASQTLTVGSLLDLGVMDGQSVGSGASKAALFGNLNAFDLVTAALQAANGSSAIALQASGISIAGVGTVGLSGTVLRAPRPIYADFAVPCTTVQTAQANFTMTVALSSPLSVTLPLLGTLTAPVTLTASFSMANGSGTLLGVGCPTSNSASTVETIEAQSSVAAVSLAGTINLANLIQVQISDPVSIFPASNTQSFLFPAASNTTYSMSSSSSSSIAVGATLQSGLSGGLQISLLNAPLLSLSTATPLISSAAATALSPLFSGSPSVIDQILQSAFGAVGLSFGNVTIFPTGARCSPPILVL